MMRDIEVTSTSDYCEPLQISFVGREAVSIPRSPTRPPPHALFETAAPRFVTTPLGWLTIVAVLVCMWWFASPLALAQTCIEDGGQSECTNPTWVGDPTYVIHNSGENLPSDDVGSDQGVYSTIYAYAISGGCPQTVQPPPYTWTLASTTVSSALNAIVVRWNTTVLQTGSEGYYQGCNVPIEQTWDVGKAQNEVCPEGWAPDASVSTSYPTGYCYQNRFQSCQAGQPTQCAGDPIDPMSGNEVETEADYSGGGGVLQFVRTYNHLGTLTAGPGGAPNGAAGQGWSHTYERRLWLYPTGVVRALRPDGSDRLFLPVAGGYQEYGTGIEQLTNGSSGGLVLTDGSDTQETYDINGTLQEITYRGGQSVSLSYSTTATPIAIAPYPGLLLTVVDTFGHQLSFTYNDQGLIATLTDPNGGVYTYSHSEALLTSVAYPDSTSRQYLYNESSQTGGGSLAYALTGIIDEAGTRYATISYAAGGQAVASQLAGGVNSYSIFNSSYSLGAGYGITNVKDPLGTSYQYNYTVVGGVGKYNGIYPSCPTCAYAPYRVGYDANGNVSSEVDYNGNQTTRLFDLTRNLETSRTEAVGTAVARTITTQWNPSYRVPALITEPNRTTAFSYDGSGNLLTNTVTDTTVTPNVSRTWTYTYNSYGQVLTAQGPRTDVNSTRTYTYYNCTSGAQCGRVQTLTDELGHVTTFNTYNAVGQPLTITDPNGVLTTLTYDARQRLTSRSVAGETTTFSYYPVGLLKTVTLPDSSYLTYVYDGAHRLTQITDGLGDQIVYTLDAKGNHIAESIYDPSNALTLARNRVFNGLGELSQQIGSANTAAVTTTFGYDNNGNQTSVDAPLSRNTANQYDALNRLIKITDPNGGVTKFSYDSNDNLTVVLDPRSLTTGYTYDGFGDLVQQSSPDTGTTVNTYDSGGNLATATDARNKTGTYTYDVQNRLTQIAYGDQTIAFGYDTGVNGIGHLTTAGDANHALAWGYDALGRVVSKTQTAIGTGGSPVTKSVSYSYTNGDLTSLVTPSGQTIAYGYANGQITSIAVNGNALLSQVVYEPFGPVAGWTWANNTNEARVYNQDGNVTNLEAAEGFTYGYDNAFRITAITDTDNAALSQTYGYDLLDRLASASGSSLNESWTYDANGNRQTQGGATSSTYTVASTSNRIAGITGALARTYAYAPSGQISSYGGLVFSYMDSGRLSAVSNAGATTTYVLNALGQRIKKSGTSVTLFVYDESGHLLGEYDGTGNLLEETIWMGDVPVATLQPNGTGVSVYYVHTDHLNAPRRISRPADNVIVWRWDSDPFGTAAANQDPDGDGISFVYNPRFPGQYYDVETGLLYNGHRDYDPASGRYIESDPIGLAGGSYSTYAYVDNEPVSLIDLTGLVMHKTGQTIDCGKGCSIRIDYTFDEKSGTKARHLHWECKGRAGECGENGKPSHGGTWEDVPEFIKQCALKNGFAGANAPIQTPTPTPNIDPKTQQQIATGAAEVGIGTIIIRLLLGALAVAP